MENLMTNILESGPVAFIIIYMILLLIIYHSCVTVIYTDMGKQLLGELFFSFMGGGVLMYLTYSYWKIAAGILALIIIVVQFSDVGTIKKRFVQILGIILIVFLVTGHSRIEEMEKENEKKTNSTQPPLKSELSITVDEDSTEYL